MVRLGYVHETIWFRICWETIWLGMFMKSYDYQMYKDDKTMISLENNMARTCIWKRYDYEVFTKWYDYDTACEWQWYEICYYTRYVINWHVYDMI